jgi:hypothetical protein
MKVYGTLNFSKLVEDGIVEVGRDYQTKDILPLSIHKSLDTPQSREVEYGQHTRIINQKLGICRIITVSSHGFGVIWEGQFKDNKLNGFAR